MLLQARRHAVRSGATSPSCGREPKRPAADRLHRRDQQQQRPTVFALHVRPEATESIEAVDIALRALLEL